MENHIEAPRRAGIRRKDNMRDYSKKENKRKDKSGGRFSKILDALTPTMEQEGIDDFGALLDNYH